MARLIQKDMTYYIKSKTVDRSDRNRGLAVLSILIIFSIFCLSFFYLIQTNALVSANYQIREKKQHLAELEKVNQALETQIAQWQSPAYLESFVERLNMVEVGQVVYLSEKEVAVKR